MSNEELIGKWMMERAIKEGHRPGLPKSAEIQEETIGKIRTTMRRVTPDNLRYEEVCLAALKSGPKSYAEIAKMVPSIPGNQIVNALRRLQTLRRVEIVRLKGPRLPFPIWKIAEIEDEE
jgi:hypothetical protein